MRKRVHELSKEWNVDPKDLIAKLEKLGIHGKRSQSSLTDDEVERLRIEHGTEEKPSVTVGDERVVEGIEGQTVVERRVKTNVIRRRTTRVEPVLTQEGIESESAEPLPLATEAFESFASAEPLPEPLPPPSSFRGTRTDCRRQPQPVAETTAEPAAPARGAKAPAATKPAVTTMVEPLRGPRVLGTHRS